MQLECSAIYWPSITQTHWCVPTFPPANLWASTWGLWACRVRLNRGRLDHFSNISFLVKVI